MYLRLRVKAIVLNIRKEFLKEKAIPKVAKLIHNLQKTGVLGT
jgi:hypothetical protein